MVNVHGFTYRTEVVEKAATERDGDSADLVIPYGRGMNASICKQSAGGHDVWMLFLRRA